MAEDDLFELKANKLSMDAVLVSLMVTLVQKGVLSSHDARDVYENALMVFEHSQTQVSDEDQKLFSRAREILEGSLTASKNIGRSSG